MWAFASLVVVDKLGKKGKEKKREIKLLIHWRYKEFSANIIIIKAKIPLFWGQYKIKNLLYKHTVKCCIRQSLYQCEAREKKHQNMQNFILKKFCKSKRDWSMNSNQKE